MACLRTSPRRTALLAGLLLLVGSLAGCLTDGQPPGTIEREEALEPGSFLEANLAVNESAELVYRWSTTPEMEIAFDVHGHPSRGEVAYHERYNASSGEGTFTAPSGGTYSLMWENTGDEPLTLSFTVEGDVELVSLVP